MAAYAALTSVMRILEQIQNHPRPPISLHKQQNESLSKIISFLQDFLENHSHGGRCSEAQGRLESQIADAAYAAEDIIESHIVDQILATERSSNNLFYQDLQKVIEDMNLIKKEAIQIQEKNRGINEDQLPRNIISTSANNIIGSSTVPLPTRKPYTNTMVGFDDVLFQIMDRLTGYPTNCQVLPIVGMGGIGKTTLAINVYDHPTIVQHFHIRIWVTISQDYRLRELLLEALSSLQNDENKSSEDELGDQLHKSLCGRRYLIILDDMWNIEAWKKLMLFFPDNNNGSRIMITTRLSNVSNHFSPHSFKLDFLGEDKSWDLFCKIVFPKDQCRPLELEEIGKKISRNCKGLPLSIVVIGGLLANSEKTLEHSKKTLERWEYVEKNLNSMVNLVDEQHCLKILFLSYNDLPVHLKPCFLYLGVYPEDKTIYVPRLIQLWVDEGFLKPVTGKTLEMAAREYFNQLVDRNLMLVHKWGSSGKVKYCKIHDLLRDLCLKEGQKDKFLWVRTVHKFDNLEGIRSQRRISIHEGKSGEKYDIDRVVEALSSASLARTLSYNFKGVLSSHSHRLVRVFKKLYIYSNLDPLEKYKYSVEDIFRLVNLRCLAVKGTWNFKGTWNSILVIPSSIHLLWNLQTLIIKCGKINVPPEIWEMSQLRHLEIGGNFILPDPPNVPLIHEGDDCGLILRNLHTLKVIKRFKLSEEVIKRIPNVKKLKVSYFDYHEGWWHHFCLNNLVLLNKLESLDFDLFYQRQPGFRIEFLPNFAFPHSLKKLTLLRTNLLWEDMRMIGSLPNLQVLKLRRDSFRGPEWNPVEGEFLCLKFLVIENCYDLACWTADRTHFPRLEQLVLRRLYNLKEIPFDIGQIPTIRSIEVWLCSDSTVMSAKNILDEQVEIGNDNFQVRGLGNPQFSS